MHCNAALNVVPGIGKDKTVIIVGIPVMSNVDKQVAGKSAGVIVSGSIDKIADCNMRLRRDIGVGIRNVPRSRAGNIPIGAVQIDLRQRRTSACSNSQNSCQGSRCKTRDSMS